MCVTGGADRSMGVPTYTSSVRSGPLSPNHSAPFDERANGFVSGEGAGIMVLKRLSDARRDGDRVYAVIRGIGASSDGKGKGITNPRGQAARAQASLCRGRNRSGRCGSLRVPWNVDRCRRQGRGRESHGGDWRGSARRSGSDPTGLRNPTLGTSSRRPVRRVASRPPSRSTTSSIRPPSFLRMPVQTYSLIRFRSRFRRMRSLGRRPTRRVGISAFGFGGTNFHVVMEEDREIFRWRPSPPRRPRRQS